MRKPKIHADEELLQVYRKHEIALAPKILQALLLLFVVLYFGFAYGVIFSSLLAGYLFAVFTACILAYIAHLYTLWTLNLYFLTTKRLVHIVHVNIFKKTEIEAPLARILNVSFSTTSMLSHLFNYGNVNIQIVGLAEPLILKKIPKPEEVKDFIWKTHLQYAGEQKLTYTQPEITAIDNNLPYAP